MTHLPVDFSAAGTNRLPRLAPWQMVNDRSEPRVKRARQILGIIARHLSRRCETNWPILIWLSSLLRRHDRRPLRYAAIPEVTILRDDQFVFPPDWFLTKPRLQKVKVPSNRHYLKGQVLARRAFPVSTRSDIPQSAEYFLWVDRLQGKITLNICSIKL